MFTHYTKVRKDAGNSRSTGNRKRNYISMKTVAKLFTHLFGPTDSLVKTQKYHINKTPRNTKKKKNYRYTFHLLMQENIRQV